MTEPIQQRLYAGFAPADNPGTSGEIAAKACLDDLCKTWNAMLDADMPLPTSRILFDVDAVIETLERFKLHVSGLKPERPPNFKILKGKEGAR